jgi:hypothetical protein
VSFALNALLVPLNDLTTLCLIESHLEFPDKPLFQQLAHRVLLDEQVRLSA